MEVPQIHGVRPLRLRTDQTIRRCCRSDGELAHGSIGFNDGCMCCAAGPEGHFGRAACDGGFSICALNLVRSWVK